MYGDKMKYIVLEEFGSCDNVPILFPNFVEHAELARKLGGEVVSAGFVSASLECSGQSISLKKKSREVIDTKLVRRYFGSDSDSKIEVIY